MHRRTFIAAVVSLPVLTALSCGSDSGVRVVSPADANSMIFGDRPEGLVVLDIRTPEEFMAGYLPEAQLLDFYRPDFAAQLAQLDRDVPYLMYCRSGSRSSKARATMKDLGFTDVRDIGGGYNAWIDDGQPFVIPSQ